MMLTIGFAATPAAAHTVPDDLAPSLTYAVSGFVSPKCELTTLSPAVDIPNLANPTDNTIAAVNIALPFEVSCNAPVRVAMTSRNSGLMFQGAGTNDPAFSDLVRYRARIDLPGAQNVLNCSSERMADGRKTCESESKGTVGSGRGAVQVQVSASQEMLMAGKYSDSVTIMIAPRLGGDDTGQSHRAGDD